MEKRIQLNEAQLKQIIREAVQNALEKPVESDYGEYADVIDFLKPCFDELGYKYKFEVKDNPERLTILFKHKIGEARCRRLCSQINANLEWSKFSNYTCRWGISADSSMFFLNIYKKSDNS